MTAETAPHVLHVVTPLIHSSILSNYSNADVYLKLETVQPSGSFKTRGIGSLSVEAYKTHGAKTHFITSSGGNAGFAAAYCAKRLGCKCTVFVPAPTRVGVQERLRGMGAECVVGGADWHEADQGARERVRVSEGGVYVPPFDHDLVVAGNATIVSEIISQLRDDYGIEKTDLSAVVCSVGGGGLLSGILSGLRTASCSDVPIVAIETRGAASLALSLNSSFSSTIPEPRLERLPEINTIARSLGASAVSETCLKLSLAHEGGIASVVVEDERTLVCSRKFVDDHSLLLEPGCSICFIPLYFPIILSSILASLPEGARTSRSDTKKPVIVVIVCGGNVMSLVDFTNWEQEYLSPAGRGLGQVDISVGAKRWGLSVEDVDGAK